MVITSMEMVTTTLKMMTTTLKMMVTVRLMNIYGRRSNDGYGGNHRRGNGEKR